MLHISFDFVSNQASAVKCCGTNYAYSSDCVDSSLNPGSDGQFVDDAAQENPWYPVQSLGYCVNDGNEANHFISDDYKFVSVLCVLNEDVLQVTTLSCFVASSDFCSSMLSEDLFVRNYMLSFFIRARQ